MNKLVIPPPPSWYEHNILACAPDNTVIYASRNDVIVIYPKPPEEPADVKILARCHRDRVVAVVACSNWGNPDKLAVSIGDDKVVCLLDIATCKVKLAHSGHTTRSDKLVGVTFAGHDRVISVSEDGFIVIWRWASNQLNSLSDLLGSKVKVVCVSSCPHASWLTAFGLKRGEIIVTDLRRTGRVLYKLKGHDSSIISLCWCPTPYNVFPKHSPKNIKTISHKAEKATEDKLLVEVSENVSPEVKNGGAKTESNANFDSTNEVEEIPPKHQTETKEEGQVSITAAGLMTESFSTREVIKIVYPDFKKMTENVTAVDTETVLPTNIKFISTADLAQNDEKNTKVENDGEVISTENLTEVASSKIINKTTDIKTEDITAVDIETISPTPIKGIGTADLAQTEVENDGKVISTENVTEIASAEIINTTEDTNENIESSTETSNMETITNTGDNSRDVADVVEVTKDNSILANQDLVLEECVSSHESNGNQEPHSDNVEDHSNAVENIETEVTNTNSEENLPLKNENESQESPDETENFKNQPEKETESAKEYLLASSARGGRSIIIWRAGTDGIKQVELNLPSKSRGNQRSHQPEEKSWITLCWVTPKNLLSSSPKGELYQWNLAASSKGTYKWRLIHGDHNRHIFGIAAPIRLHESPDDEDWRDKNLLNAWTVGRDRYILNTSLCAERKTLASYPTIAGSINCLAPSAIYPSKIAIGAGEGSCRLWDLSRSHLQYNVMTQFSDRSQHKIISLAWHPTKETILAFGTTDGRVGFMDPLNCSKPATFFVQHVNSAVHRLEWGPSNENREHFILYAVTGGQLIAYDINKQLDAPIMFDVGENITQMSWKPDYSVCAVATKAGHVSLFSPEMKLITTLYLQNKTVRWITWHPEATIEDDGVSPYANWLAVATNDVTVYDCSLDNGSDSNYSERIVAVLKEHAKFVECLSWSTFEGGKLASASDDGTALVWDVKTKTLLHSCVMPMDDVLTSVLWSPLDRDYIITGGKSGVIQIWKLSENPPQKKLAKKQNRKILKLKEVETPHKEVDAVENVEEIEEIEKPKKCQRRFVLSGLIEAHNRNSYPDLLQDCKRLFDVHYGNSESKNGEIEDDKQLDILKVFGNEHNLDLVLDLEKKCNAKKKIVRSASHISLWRGDTANAIRIAIHTRTLNPWLISMAPTISHNLYLEACESYADHLSEDVPSNAYEAVSYYLACHKLEKAIDVLCTTKNYLEAVVLAKCRLVPTDPLITKIIERWAEHCAIAGSFEVAAQCYIVLHRLEDAAKMLFKRTDENSLKFCAELAKHFDNKNFLDAILFRLNSCSTTKENETYEIPLLSRLDLELDQQRTHAEEISNGNNIEEVIDANCEKIDNIGSDCIKENDKVILGDGQSLNNIPTFNADKQKLEDVQIEAA